MASKDDHTHDNGQAGEKRKRVADDEGLDTTTTAGDSTSSGHKRKRKRNIPSGEYIPA